MGIEKVLLDISTFTVTDKNASVNDYDTDQNAVRIYPNTSITADGVTLLNIELDPEKTTPGNTQVVQVSGIKNSLLSAKSLFYKSFIQTGGQASISLPTWDGGSEDTGVLFTMKDVDCENRQVVELEFSAGDTAVVEIDDIYNAVIATETLT